MDAAGEGAAPPAMSPESLTYFVDGIILVLSQWTALQMAVQNQWGGRDSRRKADELAEIIHSWFTNTKTPLYIDDLENILDENMILSFNTELDDGSVEEVAEQLMTIHEDCVKGNYESVERLRNSNPVRNVVSQSKQVADDNEDDTSNEEESDMLVDEPKPNDMVVGRPTMKEMRDEEGWSVVSGKRNRGKRSG